MQMPNSPVGKRLHAMAHDISSGIMSFEDLDTTTGMPSPEHGAIYKKGMLWLVEQYQKNDD